MPHVSKRRIVMELSGVGPRRSVPPIETQRLNFALSSARGAAVVGTV